MLLNFISILAALINGLIITTTASSSNCSIQCINSALTDVGCPSSGDPESCPCYKPEFVAVMEQCLQSACMTPTEHAEALVLMNFACTDDDIVSTLLTQSERRSVVDMGMVPKSAATHVVGPPSSVWGTLAVLGTNVGLVFVLMYL